MLPEIVPIACLDTNYAYLVFRPEPGGDCVVIDPGEAAPVKAEIERRGLRLRAILNTHHHWDHVDGNVELLRDSFPDGGGLVFAHASDASRVPGFSNPLEHGEEFTVAKMSFRALHVPGHTSGALAYLVGDACFTGDTLFCGGCGRLFEGTPEQLYHSLTVVLGELPDSTLIYTGHEYTEANLEFAASLLPSPDLVYRLKEVVRRRQAGEYCASAPMGLERSTNPFLRVGESALREILDSPESEQSAFAQLRRLKDMA